MLYLHSSFNCYVILPEGKNGFVVKSHEERVQLTASDKLAAIIKHSTAITRFWQRHFFFHPPLKAVNSLHYQIFIQEANKRATKSCFTKKNKTINGPDKPKEMEGLALANVMLLTS